MAEAKRKLQAVSRLERMSVMYAVLAIGAIILIREVPGIGRGAFAAVTLLVGSSLASLIAAQVVDGVAEGFRRAISDARRGRFS